MTDKEQIMIDGVDVTECDHFSMELPFFNDPCTLYPHGTRCSENKNCYYKQLARKTQECKEREQDAENWAYKAGLAIGKASRYLKALEEIERICVYLQERPIYAESIIPTYLKPIKIQDDFEDKILDIISNAKAITT